MVSESKSLSGQGQTCAGINGTILRQPSLPDTSRSELCQKIWRQLRWRGDVWRWGEMFEPAPSLLGPSGGVYMGRQVMYYLEEALALCLIRAWLREAVTAGFSACVRASAQEWRWTCDHHGALDQYVHTLTVKCGGGAAHFDDMRGPAVSLEYLGNIAFVRALQAGCGTIAHAVLLSKSSTRLWRAQTTGSCVLSSP